ncbi:hypothetical protein, partial [Ligilactobacillus ruminis]|uniref:hypothetical protein n=1 Tax=Ligilactobacillus ruminis TaxID=1623 RepID=UPI0019D3DEC3
TFADSPFIDIIATVIFDMTCRLSHCSPRPDREVLQDAAQQPHNGNPMKTVTPILLVLGITISTTATSSQNTPKLPKPVMKHMNQSSAGLFSL